MEKEIKVTCDTISGVLHCDSIKNPHLDSANDFVNFLVNLNYRLEKLEEKISLLQEKSNADEIFKLINERINKTGLKGTVLK